MHAHTRACIWTHALAKNFRLDIDLKSNSMLYTPSLWSKQTHAHTPTHTHNLHAWACTHTHTHTMCIHIHTHTMCIHIHTHRLKNSNVLFARAFLLLSYSTSTYNDITLHVANKCTPSLQCKTQRSLSLSLPLCLSLTNKHTHIHSNIHWAETLAVILSPVYSHTYKHR